MVLVIIAIYLLYRRLKQLLDDVIFGEKDIHSERVNNLKNIINRRRLHSLLVTNLTNIHYLTGFTGSSGCLIITKDKNIFLTDFRYKEEAEGKLEGWDIIIEKGKRIEVIKKLIKNLAIKNMGFESSVSFDFFDKLTKIGIGLKPLKGVIEDLRAVKDDYELSAIRMAVERAEKSFLEVKPFIKSGVTERGIMLRLEERLKKNGCKKIPFEIIVASGKNSSKPHAKATDNKVRRGDFLIIDWGGECNGYYSDITRTFIIRGGSDLEKKRFLYKVVLEANKNAIRNISLGKEAHEIDKSARDVIEKAGYGENFGHGTGHGVGLDVHELPSINRRSRDKIKENMVFTVEPGIYITGLGGVRIEDMVIAKEKDCLVLTSLNKELEII